MQHSSLPKALVTSKQCLDGRVIPAADTVKEDPYELAKETWVEVRRIKFSDTLLKIPGKTGR